MRTKKLPATVRNSVWLKYIGDETGKTKCFCCNLEDIGRGTFECGHIISVACGGSDKLDNLRPICGLCNKSMGIKNMELFMKEYGYEKNNNWDVFPSLEFDLKNLKIDPQKEGLKNEGLKSENFSEGSFESNFKGEIGFVPQKELLAVDNKPIQLRYFKLYAIKTKPMIYMSIEKEDLMDIVFEGINPKIAAKEAFEKIWRLSGLKELESIFTIKEEKSSSTGKCVSSSTGKCVSSSTGKCVSSSTGKCFYYIGSVFEGNAIDIRSYKKEMDNNSMDELIPKKKEKIIEEQRICIAIRKDNGQKCSFKAKEGSNYCGKHTIKY